jgi:hypothetical protein
MIHQTGSMMKYDNYASFLTATIWNNFDQRTALVGSVGRPFQDGWWWRRKRRKDLEPRDIHP